MDADIPTKLVELSESMVGVIAPPGREVRTSRRYSVLYSNDAFLTRVDRRSYMRQFG
jgi:hypothetical protein